MDAGVSEGAVDAAEPDVAVDDLGVGLGAFDVAGHAGRRRAAAAGRAGGAGGSRVGRVQPEHVGIMLITKGGQSPARYSKK